MGFATGLRAGTISAGDWIDNYKLNKQEDIQNKLFKVKSELEQGRMEVDAEGNQIQQMATDFSNMSGDEISNTIMEQVRAEGGKIDDQTYGIAWKMGQMFDGAKMTAEQHQNKLDIQEAKERNYDNLVFNRERAKNIKARRSNSGMPYELDGDGNIDPTTVDTTSKWFKSLPKDQKRTVLDSQGIKSTPTAPYVPAQSNKVFSKKTKEKAPVRGEVRENKIYDGKKWIDYNRKNMNSVKK